MWRSLFLMVAQRMIGHYRSADTHRGNKVAIKNQALGQCQSSKANKTPLLGWFNTALLHLFPDHISVYISGGPPCPTRLLGTEKSHMSGKHCAVVQQRIEYYITFVRGVPGRVPAHFLSLFFETLLSEFLPMKWKMENVIAGTRNITFASWFWCMWLPPVREEIS